MGSNAKLVVCIMGQDCHQFLKMCLPSVMEAYKIIYCDGGSSDDSVKYAVDMGCEVIVNNFDKKDPAMNGRQRNFYLNHLREFYVNDWALCLDADEVVEDIDKIKEFINHKETSKGLYSPKMRHLIQDLKHEDSVTPEHFCLHRLFKIDKADKYPEVEHSVLQPNVPNVVLGECRATTIWHLAYIPNLWAIKERYESHMAKSNIHTPEYLKQWYHAHLFGDYPKSEINPVELPKFILDEFGVDKDELYFKGRGSEIKHFYDAYHWKQEFKPRTVFEFGCGLGPRLAACNMVGIPGRGLELSKYAVDHALAPNIQIGDVTEPQSVGEHDLVVAYDLLEHIPYEKLDKAIDNIINTSIKFILVSVPVIGDPNLENDPTHIIKETKEWWVKQFTDKGCTLLSTPDFFLFRPQLMVFTRPGIELNNA